MTVCNGHQTNLFRSDPQRHCTAEVFDHVCQCTLIAAQRCSVNDVRQLLLTVLILVVHAETLCQQHIDLNGDQGVFLAEYVLVLNIQLRTVESRLVDADLILQAQVIQNVAHDTLCFFPLLRCTLVLVARICRIPLGEPECAVVQQSDCIQEILCQLQAVLEFIFQLIRTQDIVSLRNGELTNTNQTVHFAGVFVPEQCRSFRQTHRQITV